VELQARGNTIFIISNYIRATTVPLATIAIREIVTNISTAVAAQWSLCLHYGSMNQIAGNITVHFIIIVFRLISPDLFNSL
jgi:hypothetical protein